VLLGFLNLSLLRRTGIRLETVQRDAFTEPFLTELYDLACKLTDESRAGYDAHVAAMSLVHVFRDTKTGASVGFQFWHDAPMARPRRRMIQGGKLRVLPEFRRRGLHLLSGLLFFLQCKARHPTTRFYRVSIASLFGFVSISEALAWFRFFDPGDGGDEGRLLRDGFASFASGSQFRIEPSGLVHTGVGLSETTLAQFGPAYFERPSVRAYIERNPEFRSNRYFVAFWFRYDARNLISVLRTVRRKTRQ
jgi:hypothetical protein